MTLPLTDLPELIANQAQPHIPINTTFRGLEQGCTRFLVVDDSLTAPPGSPADGDAYIVAGPATGLWAGQEDHIAYRAGTAWVFIPPRQGLRYAVAGGSEYIYEEGGSDPGWQESPLFSPTSFIALSDVPSSYTGNGLMAIRVNSAETGLEFFALDAALIAFAPADESHWEGSDDPGSVGDALDQLAARVTDLEDGEGGGGGGGGGDASDITYTPDDATNWAGDVDPGNVDGALDQLAERIKDIEAGGGNVDVQIFSTSGAHTWNRPAGFSATSITKVVAFGAGGGGASGAYGTGVGARAGGGAGAGGARVEREYFTASLSATENVTVGAGGTGGAAQASGTGNPGGNGGASTFGSNLTAFGGGGGPAPTSSCAGGGGAGYLSGGSGATAGNLGGTTGNTGAGAGNTAAVGGAAGGGSTGGAVGNPGGVAINGGCGGGAGGGANTTAAFFAGGTGGNNQDTPIAGGATGANGSTATGINPNMRGAGGGGGGACTSSGGSPGGDGGDGQQPGGGGGGGGAGVNVTSGAGGDGADGIVVVITRL